MGIQDKGNRQVLSSLRQSLVRLAEGVRQRIEPFLSDKAMIKGSVYELKRKCGKPGCRCAQGQLHGRMVVSASEEGRTRLSVIPRGDLVEVKRKVTRYQELRRARTQLLGMCRGILKILDQIETLRRETISGKRGG